MRHSILKRIVDTISVAGHDAIVCLSPENFAYLSGFVVPSHSLMRWRHAAVVVTSDGAYRFLTVDMEESTVRKHAGDAKVHVWGEFTGNAMVTLAELLVELGLDTAKVGLEMDYLFAGDYEKLRTILPHVRFQAAEDYLAKLRQVKTTDEIDLMRRLSRISDRAIADALHTVSLGSTEMDIAIEMTRGIYSQGATDFKLMIVATGERSVYPNVGPTARRLQVRDICRVEIFSMLDGYHAGVCRTARVQKSPAHADDIWKHLTECKYLVLDMIKPGASSRAIYDAYILRMKKLNLPPIGFIGHGIGLHLHESPYIGMYDDVPLEAGMVLGVEPLVYDTGYGFGMQNKDMVLVTETGAELLSDITDTDNLITVN